MAALRAAVFSLFAKNRRGAFATTPHQGKGLCTHPLAGIVPLPFHAPPTSAALTRTGALNRFSADRRTARHHITFAPHSKALTTDAQLIFSRTIQKFSQVHFKSFKFYQLIGPILQAFVKFAMNEHADCDAYARTLLISVALMAS